ncbi:MAG: lipopolysaccharide biosynthesis protein [Planctomycetota bacterium]|jgi:O-antigen/teichoic acid export membrane protein
MTEESSAGPGPAAPGAAPPMTLKDAFSRLSRHTLIYSATGQLSRVVSFALLYFFTYYLPPADYGLSDVLGHIIAVCSYVAGINMTTAMARYYFDQADERQRHAVVSTTLWSVMIGALVVGGVLAAGSPTLAGWLDPARPGMTGLVLITLAILVLQMLRETWLRYLQIEERSVLFGVISVGKVVLEVSCQIWLIAFEGRGLAGLLAGILIGEVVTALVLTVMLLPRVGLAFSPALFVPMFAFTLPLVPNGLLQFCLHSADRFLLLWLAGAEEVGVYSVAYKFGYIPNYLIITPFLMIWYPFVFGQREPERQRDLIERLTPYVMFILSASVLAVALLAEDLTHLMTGRVEFVPAWRAVAPICLGYWLWGAFQLAQTGFYVRKRTGVLPWLTGIAAVVNVAANFVLIPRYGFLGAAWATLGSFAILLAVTLRAGRPIFPVSWPWARVLRPALAGAAVFALGTTFAPEAGWTSASLKAVLWLGWLAWMWAGGFLGPDERRAIREVLAGWRGRARAG